MNNIPVLPVDNSTGASPAPVNIPLSPNLPAYTPSDGGNGGAKEQQDITKMNLGELLGQMKTAPIQNDGNSAILSPRQGTERYDAYNPVVDNEELYGEDQGSVRQFSGGVVKGLADLGISFAQALTFQPKAEWGDNAKQWVNDALPNFYTHKQQNSMLNAVPFSGGAANFWGDKVVKGTADMTGMIAATALQGAVISAATEGLGEALALPEQIGMISMKMSKLMSGVDKTGEFLKDAGLEGDMFANAKNGLEGVQARAIGRKGLEQFKNLGTNFLFSHYMAAQGEHGVYNSAKQDLLNSYKANHNGQDAAGADADDIERTATSIANTSYYTDLTMFMGQAMALPGLLKAFRPAKNVVQGIEGKVGDVELPEAPKQISDLDNIATKPTESSNPLIRNVVKPFAKHSLMLGGVIGATDAAHDGIKKYFEDKYDGKARGTVDDAVSDIGSGLAKTFGTAEGLGNVLTSAMMGGVLGIGENALEARQLRKAGIGTLDERTKIAADNLMGWKTNGFFKTNYQGAVDAAKMQSDMDGALKSGDPFAYKNAQQRGFYNYIASGVRNNMHDVRIEQLKLIKQLPDTEIHALFGEDKTTVEQKKQYVDQLINKANDINKTLTALGEIIPQQSMYVDKPKTDKEVEGNKLYNDIEDYKEALGMHSFLKREYTDNLRQMDVDNKTIHPLLTNDLIESLITPEGRDQLNREYRDQTEFLDTQLSNKSGSTFYTSELRQQKLQRDTLKDMSDTLTQVQNMPNLDPIAYSKAFEKVLNFELGGRGTAPEIDQVPMEQAVPLINKGIEILENKAARKQADAAYNALFSNGGFEQFGEDNDEAQKNTFRANKQEYMEGLGLAKTSDEYKTQVDEDEKNNPVETQGESRLFTASDKKPKGYTVSKESKQDGTTRYSVKDLKGNEIKSFRDVKSAEGERDDLNKRLHYPSKIRTNGERNGDGTIKAEDEKGNPVNLHPDIFSHYTPVATPEDIVNGEDRKELNKKISKTTNEDKVTTSPTVVTAHIPDDYDPSKEQKGVGAKGKLKKHDENLISTTTASKEFPGNHFAGYHVKTSQHFLTNIDRIQAAMANEANRGTFKVRLAWDGNEKSLGLEGLVKKVVDSDPSVEYDQANTLEKTVLAVFVEHKRVNGKDEYHYINGEGKRIDGTNHEDLVFQTMPTVSKNYKVRNSKGESVSRFRSEEEEPGQDLDLALAKAAAWRERLFKSTTSKDTGHHSFTVSEGFPDLDSLTQDESGDTFRPKGSVVGRLIDRNTLDSGENILTTVTEPAGITTIRGENIPAPLGSLWLQHGSTLQYLSNRTLNGGEVDTIAKLLENYIRAQEGTKGIDYRTQNDAEKAKRQEHINSLNEITSFLQGSVYFSSKRMAAPKDEGLTDNNRMYFTDKGVLVVGAKKFLFTSDSFSDNKEVGELKDALRQLYTNANSALISKNEPFNESYLDQDGEVEQRKWKTYQHYLLSDKYDLHHTDINFDAKAKPSDRINDNVPFRTAVKRNPEAIDESNFDGKYVVLDELKETPVALQKKEAKATEPTPEPEVKSEPIDQDKAIMDKLLGENRTDAIAYLRQLKPSAMEDFDTMSDKDKEEFLRDAVKDALLPIFKAQAAKEVKDSNSITNQDAIEKKVEEVEKKQEETKPVQSIKVATDKEIQDKFLTPDKVELAKNIIRQAFDGFDDELATKKTAAEQKQFLTDSIRQVLGVSKPEGEEVPEVKAETPTEESNVDTPKKEKKKRDKGASGKYRLVTPGELAYEVHDKEASLAWARAKSPFEFESMKNLIATTDGGYAFGSYIDDHVKFYESAKKGTIEHEVGEGIWASFLSNQRRKGMLDEFRRRGGETFTSHEDGRTIKYEDASDHEAKEEIMEELGRFVQDGSMYEKPKAKGNLIYRFFRNFVDFIKGLRDGSIKKWFDEVNAGKYKTAARVNDYTGTEEYKKVGNLSISDSYSITKGVTVRLMQHLLDDNRSVASFDLRGFSPDELYQRVYDDFEEEFTSDGVFDNIVDRFTDRDHPRRITEDQFKAYQAQWIEMKENWDEIRKNANDYIKTFGVKNLEELDEIRSDNEFVRDAFKVDNNESMSASMKLLFGTMSLKGYRAGEDGETEVGEIVDHTTNMPIPVEVTIMVNHLREELSKVNTLTERLNVMNKMEEADPTISTLVNRLRIQDLNQPLTTDDLNVIANFNNTFSKQRPNANVHEVGHNFSITYPQNESSTKARQVDAWFDSWKALAQEMEHDKEGKVKDNTDSIVLRNEKTGNYEFNSKAIKNYDVSVLNDREEKGKTIPGQLSFLRKLNIEFTPGMFDKLEGNDPKRFGAAVKKLATYLPGQTVGELDNRKTGEAGNLNVIAELYLKANGITDSSFYNIDGKQQSQDVGKNYVNSINTDLNTIKTKTQWLERYSHYDQLYRKDGIYLNQILFNGDVRTTERTSTDYIQGMLYKDKGSINTVATMSHPERVLEEVNQNLAGNYYVLVGADATTEWTNTMKHIISYQDMKAGRGDAQFHKIYNDYYLTEKAIHDSLPEAEARKYKSSMVNDGIVDNYEGKELTQEQVSAHLDKRADDMMRYLQDSGLAYMGSVNGKSTGWAIKNIDTDWLKSEDSKGNFTDKELHDFFKFTEANYMINNIELFKLYYGDPAQASDWLKRVKSSLSPRESSVYNNKRFTDELNRNLNTVMGLEINPLNPRYRQHGEFLKIVNLEDHYTYIDHIVNDNTLPKSTRDAFKRNNDVDGAGWVNVTGHREIMYRRGQVTSDHNVLYNYMLAEDNQLMLQDGHLHDRPGEWGYYSPKEREFDKAILEYGLNRADGKSIHATYDAVKPIVFGIDQSGGTILNKFALAALSYRQVRKGPMEQFYMNMLRNQDHYAVTESGVKIGLDKTHPLYNTDGTINEAMAAENTRKQVSFQWFGIQTEVGGTKHKQSFLTQASVDVYLNSFMNGVPQDFMSEKPKGISDEVHDMVRVERWNNMSPEEKNEASAKHSLVNRNKDVLRTIQDHAYKSLIDKLGIKDSNGFYEIPDKQPLEDLLKSELLRRDTPQNLKDALSLNNNTGEFDTPLEAIANYKQIKDILYSYVDKVICKPKQNGAPYVMQPGISLGKNSKIDTRTVKSKGKDLTSFVTDHSDNKALQFYRAEYNEKGVRTKVHPAEIVMNSIVPSKMRQHPRWKNATDEELMNHLRSQDESMLDVIGARIPTQEMNSIEAMTLKSFLPNYQGNAALVSEGMTTKAGLDFDADKMNTYQMNIWMDKKGDMHKVPFHGLDEEEVMPRFRELAKQVYDEKAERADVEDEDNDELIDTKSEDLAHDLFKKSLQNEYYSSMHQVILDPNNYERLIRPNSADDGKAMANELEKIAPLEFSANSKGSLMNRMYMSQQRHYFIQGKREVAKLAMAQKMHAMYQLSQVYVDPARFSLALDQDKTYLGDGKLLLKTNTTRIASGEAMTVSGIWDTKRTKYISDSFSQFIDGTVDIAKGAWFMDIVQHPLMTSKLATLLHFGVDEDTAKDYLNQPIIREYVKLLAADNSSFMFKPTSSDERQKLLGMFPIGEEASEQNIDRTIKDRTKEGLDTSILKDRIEEFYKDNGTGQSKRQLDSFAKNIEQHTILQDFLKVAVYDKHLLMLQQGLTYDTKSSGDPNLQQRKQASTDDAREHCVFSHIDDIMRSTHIYNLSQLTGQASEAIAESNFKIGQRVVRSYINQVLRRLPMMSEDRFKRSAGSVEEQLLSYMLQTNPDNPIGQRINELLVDSTKNIAKKVLEFRNEVYKQDVFGQIDSAMNGDGKTIDPSWQGLANNIFLKELVVQTKNKAWDVKNIFMSRKPSLSQTADTYTDAMREFRDHPKVKLSGLYDDILTAAFLQSGIANSKISMGRFIPSEDYGRIVSAAVEKIGDERLLNDWVRSDDFFRGQWSNQFIAPRVFEEFKENNITKMPSYSEYRLAGDELKFWDALKRSKPEYTVIPIKIARNHEKVDKFTIEGNEVKYENHPQLKLTIDDKFNIKGPLGDTYGIGRSVEASAANAATRLNRLDDSSKDRIGMTKLGSPVQDDGFTSPHREYMPFRFRPDSREGQSQYLNFTAQDRNNLIRRMNDPTVKEVNTQYLLKRLGSFKYLGDGSYDYDDTVPAKINGYYVFVPISPYGDGWSAEEHRNDGGKSVLKGNGYQVPFEVRPEEILNSLQAAMDERIRKQNESKNPGQDTPPENTDGGIPLGPITPNGPIQPIESNLEKSPENTTFVAKDILVKKDDNSNWNLSVDADGKVTNKGTGKELDPIKDRKLINKAQLKSGFIDFKLIEANNGIKYAVTPEGRVFTMAETNMGTELLADSSIKKQVVDKYNTQVNSISDSDIGALFDPFGSKSEEDFKSQARQVADNLAKNGVSKKDILERLKCL